LVIKHLSVYLPHLRNSSQKWKLQERISQRFQSSWRSKLWQFSFFLLNYPFNLVEQLLRLKRSCFAAPYLCCSRLWAAEKRTVFLAGNRQIRTSPEHSHKRAHLGPSSSHQGCTQEPRCSLWSEVHLLLCLTGESRNEKKTWEILKKENLPDNDYLFSHVIDQVLGTQPLFYTKTAYFLPSTLFRHNIILYAWNLRLWNSL